MKSKELKALTYRLAEFFPLIGWLAFGCMMLAAINGCQIYDGELPDKGKYVESGVRICGKTIYSKRKRVLSKAEKIAMIDIEVLEKESLFKIESQEKRRSVLLIMALASYGLAVLAIVAGAILSGWKTFAALAAILMVLGTIFLSLVTTIYIFSWGLVGVVIAAIVRVLYLFKRRGYGGE